MAEFFELLCIALGGAFFGFGFALHPHTRPITRNETHATRIAEKAMYIAGGCLLMIGILEIMR